MTTQTLPYENTYWNGKGLYPVLSEKLQKLIPREGEVPNAKKNPALEKFRKAQNCYYDLYNNGLGNRARQFYAVFGFGGSYSSDYQIPKSLVDKTEARFNEIILAAGREQGLI